MCGVDTGVASKNIDSLMSVNVDINKMSKELKGNAPSPGLNTT